MNTLNIIFPYELNGSLVFDDPNVGLIREPFVAGADTLLRILAHQSVVDASRFGLVFSADYFPGFQFSINRLRGGENGSGDWYQYELTRGKFVEFWLCPALLKYFEKAPKKIYLKIKKAK